MRKPDVSLSRLGRLMWMDARFWMRPLLIGAGGVSLVVFLFSAIAAFGQTGEGFHAGMYGWILGLGGMIFTSRAFLELRHPLTTQNYLLVPASFEEKFLARYLISSIGYLVISYPAYLFLSLVSEGLNQVLMGRTNPLFFPGSFYHLQIAGAFLVFQAYFFAGAIYFRKYSLIKTFLTVMGMFFLLGLFTYFLFRMFFWGYFDGSQPDPRVMMTLAHMGVTGEIQVAFHPVQQFLKWFGSIWFWGVMPVFALCFAWFRLRETEV